MPRRNQQNLHKKITFINNCQPKRKFNNEKEAIKAAEYQMLIDINLDLSVYKCDICNKWHLTRSKANKD